MRTSRVAHGGMLLLVLLAAHCGGEAPAAPVAAPVAAAAPPAPVAPPPATPVGTPAAAAAAAPAEKANAVVSDLWYRTLTDGQASGWLHVMWVRSSYEGKPTIHDHTEAFSSSTRRMGQSEDTFESRTASDIERTDDGLLLRMDVRRSEAGRISDATEIWTGKGYEHVAHEAGLEEKHVLACAEPCPVDSEAFLSKRLQRGEVKVGATYEYGSANFLGKRIDKVTLRVDAEEKVVCGDTSFDCLRVTESVAGVPAKTTLWLDGTGVLRRLRAGSSEIVWSTEAEARDLAGGGATYSITLDAEPVMPRCTSLDRALVRLTLAPRDGEELPDIPKTPFGHEVSRTADTILVELTAHDEAPLPVTLPVTDPRFERHLERTNLFCHDAPAVKAALAKAVGDEKDPAEIVKKLLKFVFVRLRKASGPIAQPTAVEILDDGGGDCSEHCVLFVTLCRAAGIPARRLSGYAQVGEMWGSHSFSEVWLGRWIGCDPTTNEFGTKARYVCVGWDDDPDSFPGIASSRLRGRVSMTTEEFTEAGRTYKVQDLANADAALSGFEFEALPKGWTAVATMPSVARVSGPGCRADLEVQWGYGDLSCDLLPGRLVNGGRRVQFAGHDALRADTTSRGSLTVRLSVPAKRRLLSIHASIDKNRDVDATLAELAKVLGPTLD